MCVHESDINDDIPMLEIYFCAVLFPKSRQLRHPRGTTLFREEFYNVRGGVNRTYVQSYPFHVCIYVGTCGYSGEQ